MQSISSWNHEKTAAIATKTKPKWPKQPNKDGRTKNNK